MRLTILILSLFISLSATGQKTISFTFDDGITHDRPGYTFEEWNGMLLKSLDSANIQAIFFVKGEDKLNEKGRYLLNSWNDKGHKIANHTFTHPNFNKEDVTYEDFKEELFLADSIIREYSNYVKLFRFPYLKEGNSRAEVDSIRGFLKEQG
ncbi:polysaccharide deacetylase family protein [Nafulsella turpanensis]|uniref:polysaccharide deacetylase family protein n=1 Tax=Nafulsella turpanensis TaxID=1265690 RepID=UPI000378F7C3|nr:polysaccharide deacetylase family protein [Nafulsella turpanensis]